MLPILHYWSAKERLAESKKTIHMMGGEDECQPMLLGQRDMIQLEMEYYEEQSIKFNLYFALAIILIAPMIYFYLKN